MIAVDTTTDIETPEHVRFRYHVAGPVRRSLAYLVDLVIRVAFMLVLGLGLTLTSYSLSAEVGQASLGIILIIAFLIDWFYFVVWEIAWSGRTPGKRALSLRVIGETGHPLRPAQSFLRNFLRAADFLPNLYAVGILVMGRDKRFRRLGDLAAGTMVVLEEKPFVEGPVVVTPPPTPQELASLPQRLPLLGSDVEAIELLLRREARLSPVRVHELASMIAPTFGERLKVRVHDPVRFLKILYVRARGGVGSAAQPAAFQPMAGPPTQGYPQAPQQWGPGGWQGGGWQNNPPPQAPPQTHNPWGGPPPGARW
ncbi:MAG: RDD family protein [Polyangiaceae bacterium]